MPPRELPAWHNARPRRPLRTPPAPRPPPDLDDAVYAVSAGEGTDDAYRLVYVYGPRNLLAALGESPSVRRLAFVSSTGVYGQTGGEWVGENSPTEPRRASGKRLLEGKGIVAGGAVSAVVLRLGGIHGPAREGAIERALQAQPAGPPRYTNRIHRDDCAGALLHLLTLPNPDPLYLAWTATPPTAAWSLPGSPPAS